MKNILFLTLFNILLIIISALLIIFGHKIWNTYTFSQGLLYSLISSITLYIVSWIGLGLLYRYNRIKLHISKRNVWISMIPNALISILLFIGGFSSHLGFISIIISIMILPSIVIIPLIFFKVAFTYNNQCI